MSRNKEKAQSSLNRYHALKAKEAGVLDSDPSARPRRVQSVDSIPQAEKWRSVVVSEISQRLTRIQDAMINDQQIRDINDELNKLFGEKRAWEYHIKSLGGNDYLNFGKNMSAMGVLVKSDSEAVPKGYRYFGRAKELPEVRRLLSLTKDAKPVNDIKELQLREQKTRERLSNLGPDYFGYEDEHDPLQCLDDHLRVTHDTQDPLLVYEKLIEDAMRDGMAGESRSSILDDLQFEIPSNEQVSKWLVDRRRKELLKRLSG